MQLVGAGVGAHADIGALLALGGYVCLYAMTALGLPALLAVLVAMVACGGAGLVIYHLAARPMLSSRNFETRIFIATIGIGAVLENVILRSFGPQPVAQPLNLPGAVTIGAVHIPNQNILILAVSVLMMVCVAISQGMLVGHGSTVAPFLPRISAFPALSSAEAEPRPVAFLFASPRRLSSFQPWPELA